MVQPFYVTAEPPFHVTTAQTPPEVLRRIEARTDATGRAKLPAVDREALEIVRIVSKDYGIQNQTYRNRALPAEIVIRLRAVGRIEGRLIADKPEWARGVRLELFTVRTGDRDPASAPNGVAEVESDDQGRFVVPHMASGRLRVFVARVDESLPVRPQVPHAVEVTADATTELRIPVIPLVPVRGSVRVKDSDTPVPGMAISVDYGGEQAAHCVSDAQGRFIARVLPGRVSIRVVDNSHKYLQPVSDSLKSYEIPDQTEGFTLPPVEVELMNSIAGRVVNQRGHAVANAHVSIIVDGRQYRSDVSDAEGRFTLFYIPTTIDAATAQYEVSWEDSDGRTERLESPTVETDPFTIRVKMPSRAQPPQPRAATPGDSPPAPSSESANAAKPAAKPVDLAVIVARHVLLLDGKEIITWAELEKRIAAMPDPSLAHPTFYTTRGAHEAGLYPAAKDNIWRLHQQFKLKGHSEASLSPSADLRYDRIKTAADLVPDASLRVEGRVVDGKGEPVADAEVLLLTTANEPVSQKWHDVVLVEGRVRNPLEHVMTRSDAKGQFALYPPKDVNCFVVGLHPAVGLNLMQKKSFFDSGKVQLLPWATLTSWLADEARQEARLRIRWPQEALPDVAFNQFWGDQGRVAPTGSFRFARVPPVFDPSISLPGKSRGLDLGPLSDKQREQLEWMRKESAQQREAAPAELKPAPSPATDGGKQAEPPVNDPAGKPAAKDAALDAEKREDAQLAIDVSILGVDGKPIDQHSDVTIWERVKVAADVGARDHGWTDPRDGTIWRRVCGSISGETGPTRNGKDRFLTRNPLPPGVYRVTAFVGSRNEKMTGMAVSEPVRLDGSRKTTPVTISIEKGPPVTFTVLDAKTEKPIDYPRPDIRLTRSDGLVVEWDPLNPNLFPGNDGKYRIEHLSPGYYRVDVSARTYAYGYSDYAQEKPMAIDIREGEANEVVAKLQAQPLDEAEAKKRWPWAVEGTVTDDEGRPLEGVEIRAATGSGSLHSTLPVVTDARGRYLLRFGPGIMIWNEKTGKLGVDVQCATIFAHKPGYAERNLERQGGLLMADEMPDDKSSPDRERIVLPDKPYHLDFAMLPAATIQGRFVDEKGEPLAKKSVHLNGNSLPPSSSIAGSATTDAEGRFRFDQVTPGFAWWLELGDVKDLASSRTQPITLERGETYDVDLRIVSQEGAGKTPRIVGIKDARGRDVLGKVIGDE
jgi:protocatechuate 3,4-dioxygenase beta subunit